MKRDGSPKLKNVLVDIGGQEEQELRSAHEVMWTANAKDGKWTITVCDEIPSPETCGECVWRSTCKFSRSSERE